jgi:hypothetical protein
MAQPPSKKPTLLSSNIRLDDPTAAFPIGGLAEIDNPDELEPLTPKPASPVGAAPKGSQTPERRAGAARSPFVKMGIDLRWVFASLVGGALLAVLVVVGVGSIAILLR